MSRKDGEGGGKSRFEDPDLATPEHDAIMLWLQDNAEDVVRTVFCLDDAFSHAKALVSETRKRRKWSGESKSETFDAIIGSDAPKLMVKCAWEVTTEFMRGGRHLGTRYLDMVISCGFDVPIVQDRPIGEIEAHGPPREWRGHPTYTDYELVLDSRWNRCTLACEVKPSIRSVGELIRQLRQYESYNRKDGRWDGHYSEIPSRLAVVSPDDRFKDIIQQQGFVFIKAPKPNTGPQGGLF